MLDMPRGPLLCDTPCVMNYRIAGSGVLICQEADEFVQVLLFGESGKIEILSHCGGKHIRKALFQNDMIRVFPVNVLLIVYVIPIVPQADGYAVIFFGPFPGPYAVIGNHVRPVLVDICAVCKVDHIRCETAGRTQVYLQADNAPLFAKVGVMTFGGGYAMLPILDRELIEKRGWATNEELMDYYAVGQCTPGVIAVNTATFLGNKLAGPIGGIIASLGVVFPSVVIITLIAGILTSFADIPAVKSAFAGIRVCVCVLIFNSVLKLYKSAVVDKAALVIFAAVLVCSFFFKVSPVILVVISAVLGILLTKWGVRGK